MIYLFRFMPLTKRIIPCLDVTTREGIARVVKGTRSIDLRDAGDPVELGVFYDEQRADELVFLDITASSDNRNILIDLVERTGEQVFIPFTVGGGLKTVEDIKEILRAGADKVSLNTAAIQNPIIIKESAKIFGSQCIVTAIDAKRVYVKSPKIRGRHFQRYIEWDSSIQYMMDYIDDKILMDVDFDSQKVAVIEAIGKYIW